MSFVSLDRQPADLTVSTMTLTDTSLGFTFGANGVYIVEMFALCSSAAITTGYGFTLKASVPVVSSALTFFHPNSAAGGVAAGFSRADGVVVGLTPGIDVAGAIVPVYASGLLVANTQAGSAKLQFRPEVAAAATFKANSVLRVQQVA